MLRNDMNIVLLFIYLGHHEIADSLIKSGANFEVIDESGRTLLHSAADSGQLYNE